MPDAFNRGIGQYDPVICRHARQLLVHSSEDPGGLSTPRLRGDLGADAVAGINVA
jgi:hypothetical protein